MSTTPRNSEPPGSNGSPPRASGEIDEGLSETEADAFAAGIKFREGALAARVILRTLPELRPLLQDVLADRRHRTRRETATRCVVAKHHCATGIHLTWLFLGGLTISLAFVSLIIWMLKDQKDALLPVVSSLVGLLSVAGGGWLFGQRAAKQG